MLGEMSEEAGVPNKKGRKEERQKIRMKPTRNRDVKP